MCFTLPPPPSAVLLVDDFGIIFYDFGILEQSIFDLLHFGHSIVSARALFRTSFWQRANFESGNFRPRLAGCYF